MNCSQTEEKLGAYVDGELAPNERQDVEVHLAACGECRRALESLGAQGRELDGAFAPLRRDADALARRIIEAVHAEPARRPGAAHRWVPVIAAAAAGFLVAFLIFRKPGPPDPVVWTAKGGPPGPVQFTQQVEAAPVVARLSMATGSVEVQESLSPWASCPAQGAVPAGAQVRTAANAKCSLRWTDESELFLNNGTEIRLDSPRSVEVRRGEVYARVTERAEPFRIRTAQADFRGNGAAWNFCYDVRDGKPVLGNVAVLHGPVGFVPAEGRALELDPMLVKASQDGQLALSESRAQMVLATRWVHELLPAADPEIDRRVHALLDEVGASKGADPCDQEIHAFGERAAPALLSVVRAPPGKDPDRRRHAARILADLAGPAAAHDLVALLEDSDKEVKDSCLRALPRVTGKKQQAPPDWSAWARDNPGFGLDPKARREPFDRVGK